MVDLTADGEWLMTIGEDSYGYSAAFIYQKSKRTNMFSLFQEIHFGFISEAGAITDDHQWLALGEDSTTLEVHIYTF